MNKKTFSVYLSNGQRKSGLVKSFLDTMTVEDGQDQITTDDGATWPLYLEPATKDYLWRMGSGLCIISFQVFQDGEAFAVGRIYQPKKGKAK